MLHPENNRQLLLLFIGLALVPACDEPFPEYEEPQDVLSASMVCTSADTLYMVQDSAKTGLGSDPIGISLFVRNDYTQLLQGEALITGKLNFTMVAPMVRVFSTFPLGQSHVVRPSVAQNTIALTPGDTAELRIRWLPGGRTFFLDGVPYTEVVKEDSTVVRTYSEVRFHVDGEIRLFERVQPVTVAPLELVETYVLVILP